MRPRHRLGGSCWHIGVWACLAEEAIPALGMQIQCALYSDGAQGSNVQNKRSEAELPLTPQGLEGLPLRGGRVTASSLHRLGDQPGPPGQLPSPWKMWAFRDSTCRWLGSANAGGHLHQGAL